MIFGAAATAIIVGIIIDPYSIGKLLNIVIFLSIFWIIVAALALYKIDPNSEKPEAEIKLNDQNNQSFVEGISQVFKEKTTRWFTVFVFLSMTAYFMQEPILEPYAGIVFGLSVGESTQLTGFHQGGILIGMLLVGFLVSGLQLGSLRFWVLIGCIGSGLSLILIALIGQVLPLKNVLIYSILSLGFFNGNFAVGAIGSMMQLAAIGKRHREGTRMGLWGAGQAIAAGNAMIFSTLFVDILQTFTADPADSYGIIFVVEGILFLAAAVLAIRLIMLPNLPSDISYRRQI